MKTAVTVMAMAFLMAACNGGVEPQAATEADDRESVFDPMTDQIEKAKQVEDVALQHKEAIDQALEDAETDDH
jgi:hypothetical protein